MPVAGDLGAASEVCCISPRKARVTGLTYPAGPPVESLEPCRHHASRPVMSDSAATSSAATHPNPRVRTWVIVAGPVESCPSSVD